MSRFRYVLRSLIYFWRVNLAVCFGVVAATAVLTGALLVGDSMRGSLRKISLDGLGSIDEILLANRFFDEGLATKIQADDGFQKDFSRAEPIVLFPNASATYKSEDDQASFANQVTLIGCRNEFWNFSRAGVRPQTESGKPPEFNQLSNSATTIPIVINEPLAEDLRIASADLNSNEPPVLTVRIPKPQLINADNPIGKKEDLYETIARLQVVSIIPAESVGRFTIHPSQLTPRILFLPIATVQEALQKEEMANAILVSLKEELARTNQGTTQAQSDALNKTLSPSVSDLGFIFKDVEQSYTEGGQSKTVFEYVSLSSDQLLLNDTEVELAMNSMAKYRPQEVLTYLANALELVDSNSETIPFSMVSAIDISDDFPLQSALSDKVVAPISDTEIVINSWVAKDFLRTAGLKLEDLDPNQLRAEFQKLIGKTLEVRYFEPEASHGKLINRSTRLTIADIAKVVDPKQPFNRRRPAKFDQPPTVANDPDLTPFVPGVTDQNSINKWDLPFKTDIRQPVDDDYWQFFRTTPKAFVSLSLGQELWKSRFGKVTSIRLNRPAKGGESVALEMPKEKASESATASSGTQSWNVESLEEEFLAKAREILPELGFQFIPIKRRNLQASSGSTPFDVLFLALSFFIIAAALILISLLFRLGVDQKVSQLGLLTAVGMDRKRVARLLIAEGVFIAVIGSGLGIIFGVLYAKIMVYGLTTWWVGAVVTGFMEFHWTTQSLVIGMGTGVLVSVATVWVSIRRLHEIPVRGMLAGKTESDSEIKTQTSSRFSWLAWICLILAVILSIIAATSLGGEAQAGAFMGGGFLMLTAFLTWAWLHFRSPEKGFKPMSRRRLAVQNASRNPLRSTLTIGLVAAATFLIVAVSSFHLTPTEEGTGGFAYIGESSRPVVGDFQDPEIRSDLLSDAEDDLEQLKVFSIRYLPGDEAGCNNPFQAQRPQVYGMTEAFIRLFDQEGAAKAGFAWAGSTASSEDEKENPWRLLESQPDDGTVPVVIDKNTAMYSLKIFGVGGNYEVEFDGGQKVVFRVVGFLSNSTLQGSLIVSEKHFEKLFPQVTGYRKFLIRNESDTDIQSSQIQKLESALETYGFDATSSVEVLESFLAVQNTYLSTFQTLGAFGLLLGTFGLATVQMRNVVERRKELALLQALGFSKQKVGGIVLAEHASLLFAGMLIGTISALFSVVPHILFGDANVPLLLLGGILLAIMTVGLISGFGAVTASVKTPILSALRSED